MTIDTIQIDVQPVEKSKLEDADLANLPFGKVFSDHMLVAEYKEGQWASCKIVPYTNLNLSPALCTLHYGQTIFEGLKAYKNDKGEALVFRPYDNYQRMLKSAERMCMPAVPEEIFIGGIRQLLTLDHGWIPTHQGASLYIRPFMFGADEFIGIRPSDTYKFIIFTCPVGAYYTEPVNVKIETEYTRAFPGGIGSAKTAGNYAASLYPARINQEKGYHQLIWTDGIEHKYIEEAGTMNIMFRKGNQIFTPNPSDTILNGITRRSVVQLAKDWGYDVQERPVEVQEVIDLLKKNELDEAFGAGTAATIAHIIRIHHKGVDYELPPVSQRTFSNKVLKTLDDIKYGRIADPHGWIMHI